MTSPFGWSNSMYSWPGTVPTPAFEMIEDAKNVYTQIREAQKAA
jgi:hypothetical protein